MKEVTERTEPVGGIDEQALVAPLEKMPALAPVPVEAQGKGALQPLHAGHQISARRSHRQVIVVGHHAPRGYLPARFLASSSRQARNVSLDPSSRNRAEQIVAAGDNVINGTLEFEPELASHDRVGVRALDVQSTAMRKAFWLGPDPFLNGTGRTATE